MPIRPTEIWVNPGYDDYFEHNNIVQIKTHFLLQFNWYIWGESGSCFIYWVGHNNLNSSTKCPKITPIFLQSEFEVGSDWQTKMLGTFLRPICKSALWSIHLTLNPDVCNFPLILPYIDPGCLCITANSSKCHYSQSGANGKHCDRMLQVTW